MECLRLLGNALVALSDLRLNLMSPVPRHLHVVRPFSHYSTPANMPGAVHHHIPVQVREHNYNLRQKVMWTFCLIWLDCPRIFTNRWTWAPQWLSRLTAPRDQPRPPSRPASRSRRVRDRPFPRRLPRPISRRDRDRPAPGSSGSATRQSRWSWCRWTRMVCCPVSDTDWMLHFIRGVCVSRCWAAVHWNRMSAHMAPLPPPCPAATSAGRLVWRI